MRHKKSLTGFILTGGLFLLAFTFRNDPVEKLVASLKKFAAERPLEKVFIHTDKPYYAAGDTIWYKGYVVDGSNTPTGISNVLYVDLLNEKDSVVSTHKVKLNAGLGNAQIALPINLKAGNYTLYGYTRWMRNFDQEFFFKKTLAIGNAFLPDKTPVANAKQQQEINFFPEGGDLIDGIRSVVAFKSIGANGLGIKAEGHVEDQQGNKIIEFTDLHLGMGKFALTPEKGKLYLAVLKSGLKVPLPASKPSGYVLSVNNRDTANLGIRINLSADLSPGQDLFVVVQQHAEVKYLSKFKATAVNNLRIPKNTMQSGIAQVTLFSGEVPLAERLVFIDRADGLKVSISVDKNEYRIRDSVALKLKVTDRSGKPVRGSFSLSVLDDSKIKYEDNVENNIRSGLLLTSDLKGLVESPGYYFNQANEARTDHLDLLMLTQGWRRFNWKEVLADKYPQLSFKPEKHLSISGTLFSGSNKPLTNAKAVLMASRGSLFTAETTTGTAGSFMFDEMSFPDSLIFMLQARNEKGKTTVNTKFDTDPAMAHVVSGIARPFYTSLADYTASSKERYQSIFNQHMINIREVEIKASKTPKIPNSANRNGPGRADRVITSDMLKHAFSLLTYLGTRVPGLYKEGDNIYSTRANMAGMQRIPIQFFMDGHPTDFTFVEALNIDDVEGIEVLVSITNRAAYGYDGGGGVVEITTKRGPQRMANINSPGLRIYKPKGYVLERTFYAPKYSARETGFFGKDLRSTIFWDANVITDETGNAHVKYFNADGVGAYKVIIQGIDADGKLGYGLFEYSVVSALRRNIAQ